MQKLALRLLKHSNNCSTFHLHEKQEFYLHTITFEVRIETIKYARNKIKIEAHELLPLGFSKSQESVGDTQTSTMGLISVLPIVIWAWH